MQKIFIRVGALSLIFSNTHAKNQFLNIYFKYRKCIFVETLIPQEFQVNLPEGFNDFVGVKGDWAIKK